MLAHSSHLKVISGLGKSPTRDRKPASVVTAATEAMDDFNWNSSLLLRASRIVLNSFFPRQDPVFIGTASATGNSATDCDNVSEAMEKLPVEQREILIAVCIEGKRYSDAAEKLGITVETARTRLSMAREALQNLLRQGSQSAMGECQPG